MVVIRSIETRDVRFPTSLDKTGSDAMNTAGDYSAAYCILLTDTEHSGHGMASPYSRMLGYANISKTFTIGRGNELVCAAIRLLGQRIEGKSLDSLVANWGTTWRHLVADSQLRWIGPEKGVVHLALGAVVNALWDLWARVLGKPVWRIIADMSPEEIVRLIDFRYITDAITPEEAVEMLRKVHGGREARIREAVENKAVPAYTTSAGWLGYGREKMERLLKETLDAGYRHFKLKVGTGLEEDKERLGIARSLLGYDKGNVLMVDANQVRDG
jgi:L-galactonate dehydratase